MSGEAELPEAAKTLGFRYLVGEINDIQLNFLCCQKNFDKDAVIKYAESVKDSAKSFMARIVLGILVLPFVVVALFYFYQG